MTLSATVLIVACVTTEKGETIASSIDVTKRPATEQLDTRSTTDVNQISVASSDLSSYQINRAVDTPQLTVDQLKAYADRCAPGQSASTADIDCSELSLRVRRVFKSDDRIADALITLNRLGRNETKKSVQNELNNNRGDLSFSAQAIASGALGSEPVQPEDAEQIPEDLEGLLNQMGIGVNAGAIIVEP